MKADLLLTDATVLTMAPEGSAVAPRACVVALLGDRVVYVGQDDAGLTAKRTVSLGGRCIVPGFHDAHQHMAWFGASLDEIDLSTPPVHTLADLAGAVAAAAESTPGDAWIVGNGYDENKIGGHPDRDLLDSVAPGRRVLLTHTSGHMAVVSSAVLAELGLSDCGRDVSGGTIVVDASGRPTGLLQEQAQNLLGPLRRPLAVDDVVRAVARASEVYVRQGITSVVEAGVGGGWIGRTPVEALAYQRARDAGLLAVRVELMVASAVLHAVGGTDEDDLGDGIDLGLRTGFGDDRLRLGPVKVFSDGSLIGHTAALCHDFSDSPGVRGYLQDDADALVDTIVSAHRSGWRVATHAIGDAAIDLVLDAYERCAVEHPRVGWGGRAGNTAPRHRIEHFGVARPDQVTRAAGLGVVPVPQARFVGEIGDGMRRALGPQRSEWAYRHASLLAAGIVVPGSSDRPVVDGRPMLGIHDMVNRRTASGEVLGATEVVTAHDALRAYTYGSAHASYEEDRKGWIGPGTLADLAVLSADPTLVDPSSLADIDVLATVVGGEVVWDAGIGVQG
ncbi:MAG: amidohydrolase [Actinobacteria bacterium]|nr:amidohydrolase [Actinomycetota bacterium]TXH32724.1 MAG: amidohydrolase [Actinomycetota bacterium]